MTKRKNKKKKKEKVLKDHKQKGKILTPPMVTAFSDRLAFTKWSNDLPNLVWIGLLFDGLGEKRAVHICENFVSIVKNILGNNDRKALCFISEYSNIEKEYIKQIKESLSEKNILNELQTSLYPLVSLYKKCPLRFLYSKNDLEKSKIDFDKSISIMKRVVKNTLDRRGREAMLVQTTAVYIMGITEKLAFVRGQSIGNIEAIIDYPDTEESRKVASGVRAGLGVMRAMFEKSEAIEWCTYFWNHGYEISICELQKPFFTELSKKQKESLDKVYDITKEYQKDLFKEVENLWWRIKIDISNPIKDEVLGGLISRQARLAGSIISNESLWTLDLGRIIQRCMVDTHITLTWLIKEGKQEDFENFIEYGLGQEKLLLEHLKIRLDEKDPKFNEKSEEIEHRKNWIDSQLLTNFLPVNIGNWTKKNVRKMAEEADCMDIYNLSYTPFSNAVHGMWNTLAKINLKFCTNPLHRFHRVPSLGEPPIYFGIIIQSAEIMDLSFKEWAKCKGAEITSQTLSANLKNELGKILSDF